MKKSITFMLLLIMAGSVSADLVLKAKGGIGGCPSMFTRSGQPIVFSVDNDVVTVYTQDFLVDRTFTVVTHEHQYGRVTETATVTPTGLNAVPETEYGNTNYSETREWAASSQDDMVVKLKELFPNGTLIIFTDPMGNFACRNYDSDSFMYMDLFGKKYPTVWYALIDGYVYSIHTYDSFYALAYDEGSVVWTRTGEDITTYSRGMDDVEYSNLDNGFYGEVYITQNLFNDDDKLEYMVPDFSPLEFSYFYQPIVVNDDGTVTLTRNGSAYNYDRIGYTVYNEDGEKLGSFPTNENMIVVIKGRKYVVCDDGDYECLYEINSNGSEFDLVEAVRAKSDRKLNAKRGIVTVDIDAEQAGGEVVVSTTDGKVLASKKVVIGQTQINDQPLPAGIYVVSLLKDGRVVESEKYLVQ